MTRGLGNFDLEVAGFACLPELSALCLEQVEFLVVASDGLWDVMTDEDCCALIRSWGQAGAGTAAEQLAAEATRLGSTDDIAIIVVFFPPLPQSRAMPAHVLSGGA